ncbi:MAG: hypothetical protein K1W04_00890 [Oscillospiraceae bacterium]
MNKKMLIHSGIVSLIYFVSYLLSRYIWWPDAIFEIHVFFMLFASGAGAVNCARWAGAYSRVRPKASYFAGIWPHFTEDNPKANVLCFNAFKWAATIFLDFLLIFLR